MALQPDTGKYGQDVSGAGLYPGSYFSGAGADPDAAAPSATPPVGDSTGAASSLYADPAYLAYLRAVQGSTMAAQTAASQRLGTIQADLTAAQDPGLLAQRRFAANDALANATQDRGIFNSGVRLSAQERAQQDINAQQSALSRMAAEQAGQVNTGLASQLADLKQKAAEQALNSATRQYVGPTYSTTETP